ncbi:MAG: AAA family ATPase [Spirochaetaceae bacterium 4572_59]|nr:MAG: AAA family ATPase [Spirochaetaceae bacterium 4572_59]
MEKILKNIQDSVEKYATVLSDVLKLDVEIADDSLERISGTGAFKNKVNETMAHEGCAYDQVIRSGRMQIIENPGVDPVCIKCPKFGDCEEVYEISTPIKIGTRVIGVIGFVCFTEEQKRHLLNNFKTFVEFSGQISELISSKAGEKIENHKNLIFLDLLKKINNRIDQGVLVLDKHSCIQNMNDIAEKMLNFGGYNKNAPINIKATGHFVLDEEEYQITVGETVHTFIGKKFEIKMDDYHDLFLLKDADMVRSYALSITTTQQKIGLERTRGKSPQIHKLKEKVKMVAKTNSTVLITGESGTGKELLARALHEESHRAPFVAVNCGAIPEHLIESELFGYDKGAFTGANPKGKIGKFELADKGTLFLDEVGDMPLYLQVKLLRALEEREITRIGSTRNIPIDVRVITATNKDLEAMISEKTFRDDLYYRLNVIPLQLPPLREREGDIRQLTLFFIQKFSELFQKEVVGIEDNFWEAVEEYVWPGNVRELQNTIEYVIVMLPRGGVLNADFLPKKIKTSALNFEIQDFNLEAMERKLIERALSLYGWDIDAKKIIAEKLGIGIATLYRKIKKYQLEQTL